MSELVDFSVWCNNFTTLRRAVLSVQGETARKTEQADCRSPSGCLVEKSWFCNLFLWRLIDRCCTFLVSTVWRWMVEELSNTDKPTQDDRPNVQIQAFIFRIWKFRSLLPRFKYGILTNISRFNTDNALISTEIIFDCLFIAYRVLIIKLHRFCMHLSINFTFI